MLTGFEPPCATESICPNGHAMIEDCAENKLCTLIPFSIGSPCCSLKIDQFDNTGLFSRGSFCYQNVTRCKSPFIRVGDNCILFENGSEQEITLKIAGSICKQNSECPGDLQCRLPDKTCQCPEKYLKYLPSQGRCVRREFGDGCENDDFCNVQGTGLNGYTYTSGKCLRTKTCGCDQKQSTAAIFSYLAPGWYGNIENKTICVKSMNFQFNLDVGETCHIDPVRQGKQPGVRMCKPGLVCYSCAQDNSNNGLGICRKLENVQKTTTKTTEQSTNTREQTTASNSRNHTVVVECVDYRWLVILTIIIHNL